MTAATADGPAGALAGAPVLQVEHLDIVRDVDGQDQALVTDVSLSLRPGEILGLVGESGSGKSLTALAVLGLLPDGVRMVQGSVAVCGTSVTGKASDQLRALRGTSVSMIFQDPMTSLDPCFKVGSQLVETLHSHRDLSRASARRAAIEMLGHVGIPEPERRFHAYPHELSGGLRQRVMIAAALLLEPDVLLADEPTTALDVTTQASILQLVRRLRDEFGMGVLWISHDLAVVSQLADRVAVMYAGEIVEDQPTVRLFRSARHPYTRGLVQAARHGVRGEPFAYIDGVVPEPGEWPPGCRFVARCPSADQLCASRPPVVEFDASLVRCHHPATEVGGS